MSIREKLSASRIISYLAGLLMLAFGVAASVVSALGATPGAMMPSMMNLTVGIEFGTATFIWMSFLVLVQIIIEIKQFTPWILLQFLVSLVFGWCNTFAIWLFELFPAPESIVMRFVMLALGIWFSGLGVWLYASADIMNMPSEGISRAISNLTGKPFHIIKIIFDVVCVGGACVVCFIFLGDLGEFGIGTILNALLLGTVVGICVKLWDKQLFALFDKDKTRLLK